MGKLRNKLLLVFGLLGAAAALGDVVQNSSGTMQVRNPVSNGDLKLNVKVSGTPTDALTVTGSTGVVSLASPLPAGSGGTGLSSLGSGVATFLGTPSSANLISALTDETGTGAAVFANSPVLVTPALGTPASGTLTNATGLPVSTGISGLGSGVATFLATPSSSNFASAVTGETGSGGVVFDTSPTLVTPSVNGQVLATAGAATTDWRFRRANTSIASPSVVASGNEVSELGFYGYSGAAAAYVSLGAIAAFVDGTPDSGGDTTDMPGRIEFYTTADGAGSTTKQLTIAANGVATFVQPPLLPGATVTGSLVTNTSDGSDNSQIQIMGGGASSATRGAQLNVNGNEHATEPGAVSIYAGNAISGSTTVFSTGSSGGTKTFIVDVNGMATANGGIKPSSTSTALGAYKEDTVITPTFSGTGAPSLTGDTYMYVTRVGRMVHYTVYMTYSEAGSGTSHPTNNVTIAGLPYTSASASRNNWVGNCSSASSLNLPAGYTWLTSTVGSNSNTIRLGINGDATNDNLLTYGDITGAGYLQCSGFYML